MALLFFFTLHMAAIEDLIKQVADPGLREQLAAEVARLKATKKFGLVFEEHLPELVRLPGLPVRNGVRVVKKDDNRATTYRVLSTINGQRIKIAPEAGGAEEIVERGSVVVAKAFGEPMYPALIPVDVVERAPGKPWHVLINADNYHALQLLLYGYEGKVDVIYIDPPYNSGARDWKYNNNFVDKTDRFRHSKWLSMMKKRLILARRLLRGDGVMIITIDDYEAGNLAVLLDQLFPGLNRTPVVIRYNRQGTPRGGFFRTHEYAYFLSSTDLPRNQLGAYTTTRNFRRNGVNSTRQARPSMFYSFRIHKKSLKILEVCDPPREDFHPAQQTIEYGQYFEIWPIDDEGRERCWQWSPPRARKRMDELTFRQAKGRINPYYSTQNIPINDYETVWVDLLYDASTHGSSLVSSLVGRRFPFPKSIHAVSACLDKVTWNRPNAIVLDFFAGSGTTLHAVNLLNTADGGQRRCIVVTNNEVSEAESVALLQKGARPGQDEWERVGICESVTWPRIKTCLSGKHHDGTPVTGAYPDGKLLADGFDENAVYFKLDFLDPADVTRGEKFESIVPILWMLAGCCGACELSQGVGKWFIPKANPFAVLLKEDAFVEFQAKLAERPDIDHTFLVTDSTEAFHEMAADLGRGYKSIQLYRSYIDTFRINLTEPGTLTPGGVPANPLSVAPLAPLAQGVAGAV